MPVKAQEHAPAANAPTTGVVGGAVEPGGTHNQGLQEHGPATQGTPPGGTHEVGEHGAAPVAGGHAEPGHTEGAPAGGHAGGAHAEGGHAEGGHGAGAHGAGGGHAEEGVSIHQPTWLSAMMKNFWYAGPATLSAAGATTPDGQPISGAEFKGKSLDYTYEDHHWHGETKPKFSTHPVIGTIGDQKPISTSKTETVTIDGREVVLINPTVAFARESMFPELWVISMLTALTIAVVGFLLTRNLKRVPDRKQTLLESIYSYLDDFVHGLIGDHYKRYLPLIGTIYIYVLTMNLAGIIPGWASPTANINIPAGLAIVVVLYVQYEGIRVNGLKGYLMHFVGDPWWLGPLNFPIHAVGEVARVLSLTIRLFGNIFGEDVVIVILIFLAGMFTKGFIPFQAPMYLLAMFTSFVQAMVFSILACVYIALMTTHEHEEGHGHHDEAHGVHHDGHAPAPAV
jgi:F-type H+-transporting ATPase subunit a